MCYFPEHYQEQNVDIEDSDIEAPDPVQPREIHMAVFVLYLKFKTKNILWACIL